MRSASSGISQIIDAAGRIRSQRTQQEGQGLLFGDVYFVGDKSFFVRYGYWFSHIVGWTFLVMVGIILARGFVKTCIRCLKLVGRKKILEDN